MHQSLAELAILQIQQGVCQSKSFCQWSVAGIYVELVAGSHYCWKKSLLASIQPYLSTYSTILQWEEIKTYIHRTTSKTSKCASIHVCLCKYVCWLSRRCLLFLIVERWLLSGVCCWRCPALVGTKYSCTPTVAYILILPPKNSLPLSILKELVQRNSYTDNFATFHKGILHLLWSLSFSMDALLNTNCLW